MKAERLKFVVLVALVSTVFALHAADGKIEALAASNGSLHLESDGRNLCTFAIGQFDEQWGSSNAAPAGKGQFALRTKAGVEIKGVAKYEATADGGVSARIDFTPNSDVTLNSLNVSVDFPVAALAGTTWNADDASGVFPSEFKETGLRSGRFHTLKLNPAKAPALSLVIEGGADVLLQDNRQWSTQTYSVRIGLGGKKYAAKQTVGFGFVLKSGQPIALNHDSELTLTAGPDWIPLKTALDIEAGSALDFSNQNLTEAPAGKYGRVICREDGQFVFDNERRTPRRFYGVNFCFGAQYLTHEQADTVADRLARIGYNAVRIHHYEGMLTEGAPDSTQFNEKRIEQLDYFLAALGKRGIYITTDLFVSRPVKFSDVGIDKPGTVPMDDFKIMVPVVPKALENWKKFTRTLLEHVNPYTHKRYADDPALAWLSMINEGCFGNFTDGMKRIPEWKSAWNQWLAQRYPAREKLAAAWGKLLKDGEDPAQGTVAGPDSVYGGQARARDVCLFLAERERAMVSEMKDFLHNDLHCTALVTNSNAWTNMVTDQYKREVYDYIDDHFYVDHPQFIQRPWSLPSKCDNSSPILSGATGGRSCAFTRIFGKPFTITEYNYACPGRFRGVGGILTGAMGALQGWSGIWRFAYSHDPQYLFTPAKMDYFDMVADPLGQAAERASICLFLRGDMQAAPNAATLDLTPNDLRNPPQRVAKLAADWHWAAWVTRIGTALIPVAKENSALSGAKVMSLDFPAAYETKSATILERLKNSFLNKSNPTDPAQSYFKSETNQIVIDAANDRMLLDTPRTAGGYARAGASLALPIGGVEIALRESDATVWVSAVDGAPIAASKRLILTHLTDLQNTNIRYAERARKTLLDWGTLPHLVRNGQADVKIVLASPERFEVWSLMTSSKRVAKVPSKVEGKALAFTADVGGNAEEGARMIYEIVAK